MKRKEIMPRKVPHPEEIQNNIANYLRDVQENILKLDRETFATDILGISLSDYNQILSKKNREKRNNLTEEKVDNLAKELGKKTGDLKYSKPNELDKMAGILSEPCTFGDLVDPVLGPLYKFHLELINEMVPFYGKDFINNSPSFNSAMEICKNKIMYLDIKKQDIEDVVNLFIKAEEEGIETKYTNINILSCLFRYFYSQLIEIPLPKEVVDTFKKEIKYTTQFNSNLLKIIELKFKDKSFTELRNNFLFECEDIMDTCLTSLTLEKTYSQYAYYYIALRYKFRLYRNDDVKLDDDQMVFVGNALYDSLKKHENIFITSFEENFLQIVCKEE